jgi:(1->4)-alpha-D-glucan 1-alpha-D-glucosylmutase
MSAPRATMRLQLHHQFTFADAVGLIPYLTAFGISHVYSSPILTARPGSSHGYDVIDPTRVNPELGGEAGFRQLVGALRAAGLGIIVDIVPNHMAVGGDNGWWLDVLQHGRSSRYARFFDIDWEPEDPTLHDKILVPILGRPYGAALKQGELSLAWNPTRDCFEARYFDHAFPIAPADRDVIKRLTLRAFDPTTAHGRCRLHDLLERQHFRLAWWKTAGDEINWRRFFDINELAALRIEDDQVFEATHATLFRLYSEGLIDGFRIDHIDGLTDPGGYCRRLRSRLADLSRARPATRVVKPYLIVEKILGAGEHLPGAWECDGTTGYDFMDQVSALLHDPAGEPTLRRLWETISRRPGDFAAEEDASRRETLDRSFSAQLAACVAALHRLARADLSTRDVSRAAIRRALIEILAHLRVYRTYGGVGGQSPADRAHLARAMQGATRTCLRAGRPILDQVAAWLGGGPASDRARDLQALAISRFQQLSAPLAAKAVEDTAFYRYGRLLSRVDVGFDAASFAVGIAAFHDKSQARRERLPDTMLATATHDHKRGEDVRARLAVLSEMADAWAAAVEQWIARSKPLVGRVDHNPAPSPGDIAILLQTIVGAWPPDLSGDHKGRAAFADRLAAWQQKALREAKLATDWTAPNAAYEAAAGDFLMRLFAGEPSADLIDDIATFADRIARPGAANGLAETLLKLTSPGVPDIYQGTDFWDVSLVDPDNRRPVDFAARGNALSSDESAADLAKHWRDGRIKQMVIRQALALRRRLPDLFARGDYLPCEVDGARSEHVVGFARRLGSVMSLTVVSRLPARLLGPGDALIIDPSAWDDTTLHIPGIGVPTTWRHVIGGRTSVQIGTSTPIRQILNGLTVALLVSGELSAE